MINFYDYLANQKNITKANCPSRFEKHIIRDFISPFDYENIMDPYNSYDDYFYRVNNSSFVRVLHASPDSPKVDIYIDDKLTIKDLSYKNFSDYLPLSPGVHNIRLTPSGKMDTTVLTKSVTIPERNIFTIAAIGKDPSELSLLPIEDPLFKRDRDMAYLRFVNLSPYTPNVNLEIIGEGEIFKDIAYKTVTPYIQIDPYKYSFNVNLSNKDATVLYDPLMKLKPNRIYTIYLVGFLEATPGLEVLIPLDGNTYIFS